MDFAVQDYVITAVAPQFGVYYRSADDQLWNLTLSGVAYINLEGALKEGWNRTNVLIQPDISAPLTLALNSLNQQLQPGQSPQMQVQQWSHFTTLNAIFDANAAVNAGFAVDTWQHNDFLTVTDIHGNKVDQVWNGVRVSVAVSDRDAWLYRVGYNFTLMGKVIVVNAKI